MNGQNENESAEYEVISDSLFGVQAAILTSATMTCVMNGMEMQKAQMECLQLYSLYVKLFEHIVETGEEIDEQKSERNQLQP